MTCARRPAGARNPASPTSAGSRRPDARTGRARARRLTLLLPVLALLLGALSLFPAGPASAQSPSAVSSLSAAEHSGFLNLTWTAPTSTVTGYDVHYTSAPASGNGAVTNSATASGNDPATAWVDAGYTGSSDFYRLGSVTGGSALTDGTTYRVRVRAVNTVSGVDHVSGWQHTSGTPTEMVVSFAQSTASSVEGRRFDFTINHDRLLTRNYDISQRTYNVGVRAGSTATVGEDYAVALTAANRFLDTESETTSAGLTVSQLLQDTVNEPHETLILELRTAGSSPVYTVNASSTLTLTLTDNDPPAAPAGLSVSGGYLSLKARWTKPVGPVTGYELRFKEASAPDQHSVTARPSGGWVIWSPPTGSETSTTAEIGGTFYDHSNATYELSSGTAYHVQVRAYDGQTESGNGWGAYSASQTGTPRGVPDAPTNLDVGDGDRRLLLTWTAPSGGTLTGYDVHYTSAASGTVANAAEASGSDASAAWVAVSRTGTTASQTISDLTNGTAYRVRVRATNANGAGDWAFGTGTATTPVVGLGDDLYVATEGASTIPVTLNIDPVLATASSVTLGVEFQDQTNETHLKPEDFTGLPRTVALPADTPSVTVDLAQNLVDDSINEHDEGANLLLNAIASAPYSVPAPNSVPAPKATFVFQDNDPPPAPTGLSVSGGYRTLTATWNRPVGPGPVHQYEVRFKEASAPDEAAYQNYPHTGWVTWSDTVPGFERDPVTNSPIYFPTPSTKIAGAFGDGETKYHLRNGTAYHVQVRANDGQTATGNGWSPWSATAEGTPDGSGPYRLTPDPDLLTGLTINDGTRDLRIESNVRNAVGFGGPNPIYTVQVSPGVRSVTVTPTWTNSSIIQVSADLTHVTYGIDSTDLNVAWLSGESGTGKAVRLMPSGHQNSNGTTRVEFDIVGGDGRGYRFLIQHNTAWKSANDRLGRLEVEIGQ